MEDAGDCQPCASCMSASKSGKKSFSFSDGVFGAGGGAVDLVDADGGTCNTSEGSVDTI